MAVLVAAMMIMAMMVPAWAASAEDYKIIIDNALKDETYTAYKVFDVTYANPDPHPQTAATDIPGSADETSQNSAYSYTILQSTAATSWWPVVTKVDTASQVPSTIQVGTTFTANGLRFTKNTRTDEWNVEKEDSFDAAAFATLLNNNKSGKTVAATKQASSSNLEANPAPVSHTSTTTDYTTGKLILNVGLSGAGYYFVDTTTGSMCSLDTTENTALIREKNSLPTLTKTVSNTDGSSYAESTSVNIGDKVYYKIEVTDGAGTDEVLTVHDKLSDSLTLDSSSFVITTNTGTAEAEETVDAGNYTIKVKGTGSAPADDCTFEIAFTNSFMAGLATGKRITITYSATLGANAVVASTGNPNTSKLTYQQQHTPEAVAKVYTYAGAIYKIDGTQGTGTARELGGATFALTDAGGNAVNVSLDTTENVYKYNSASGSNLITTPNTGEVVIVGFESGKVLTLTETAAPAGYKPLTVVKTLTIKATDSNTVDKTGNTTGGASFTFTASTYNNGTLTSTGDDKAKQIHADSIEIIENYTGAELPRTGGMGTTVLYIVGGMLVILAGAYLFFSRKKTA